MDWETDGSASEDRSEPASPDWDYWRPSDYTAMLIDGLKLAGGIADCDVLEVGVGSGVVLAALAALGARRLSGVDIEADAIARAGSLLPVADLRQGDIWSPFPNRRFDVVAANLPHFPSAGMRVAGRLASWSVGGADGRVLLDRLLDGLPRYLAPRGRAIVTHNGFVGLDESRARLRRLGLGMRPLLTNLVHIPADKFACMTPSVRRHFGGTALQTLGGQNYGVVHVIEIARIDAE